MKWDTVCRPTDDPFWAFLSPGEQEPVHPQTIFVYFRQLKKIYIGHSSIKDNHPGLLPLQGFCASLQIWDQLGVTWQTKHTLFFASQGPLILSILNSLSGLGYLTMWELPRWVSYFVSSLLKNYFSCFFQDFWSSPSFLAFKTFITPWSFYHPTFGFSPFFSSYYNR